MNDRVPNAVRSAGFTMTEVMCTTLLLAMVMAMSMSAFFTVTSQHVIATAQADLDLDARMLVERLRSDLWRTSTDEILVHPEGEGPHIAISFPILHRQHETNPVPRKADGSIDWDAQVIYHLWPGPPAEVRRTTFTPRGELDAADRVNQLTSTVAHGNGSASVHGHNAVTRSMIVNLVDWRLNILGPSFDGYAPSPGRRRAGFGSVVLTDGWHEYTFRVRDKNNLSTGYHMGIDWVSASPSGSVREGERQTIVDVGGGSLSHVPNTDGSWSGNYYLGFTGGRNGTFTLQMENDRWEEGNFLHTSALFDQGIGLVFDQSVSPNTFALKLTGNEIAWRAAEQTGDGAAFNWSADTAAHGTSVRVLLRGADILEDSGFITASGTNAWFTFRSGASHASYNMRLVDCFIALSDPGARMSYIPGSRQDIRFGSQSSVVIGPGAAVESDPVPVMIHATKSYVVGFLVQPGTSGYWTQRWRQWESGSGSIQSYIVRNATVENRHLNADWSGTDFVVTAMNRILTLESIRVGHAPEGVYRSRIFDTHKDAPNYRTFAWTAHTPAGGEVEVRTRVGAQPDLADAPAWDAALIPVNGHPFLLSGRYAQVQVRLRPGGNFAQLTPLFRDFTLRWEADTRSVDVGGIFSTGPDHGIVEVLIDGQPLIQAVTVDLSVYKDVVVGGGKTRRYQTEAFAEIAPRNTRGLVVGE